MTRRSSPLFAAAFVLLFASFTFAGPPGSSADDLRETARLKRARTQRAAYEAERLVAKAVREDSAGRDVEALDLYSRALALDSTNERAVQGVRDTRDRLGMRAKPSPLAERVEKELRTKRQEARYRFNAAIGAARRAIASGRPEGFRKARVLLDRAKVIRASEAGVFSKDDLADLDKRLDENDAFVKSAARD